MTGRGGPVTKARVIDLSRLLRFSAVSVMAFPLTQLALVGFTVGLRSGPVTANVAAVSLVSVPTYAANRAWVWGKQGAGRLRDVAPFWLVTLVGLAASTALAIAGHHISDNVLVVNVANMLGFGAVWLVRFFVVDELIFN